VYLPLCSALGGGLSGNRGHIERWPAMAGQISFSPSMTARKSGQRCCRALPSIRASSQATCSACVSATPNPVFERTCRRQSFGAVGRLCRRPAAQLVRWAPREGNDMATHLWITYAWTDNEEGDFDYVVAELKRGSVPSRYDRIALVPGQRLWDQFAQHITTGDLAGWAYLLTPRSVASQACREELAYALDRALSTRGAGFPLIGLVSGLPISEVPAALRVRLCVDLASTDWVEAVRAGLENRPPVATISDAPNFKARVHHSYLGNPSLKAVEFVTRFGELRYWRIAYPRSGPQAVRRGVGPAGGGGVASGNRDFVEGIADIDGVPMTFFGAGDAISPSTAAYAAFESAIPTDIAFGYANEPFGVPAQWWRFKLA
jgi:hypothetical protein